jgi:phosphoglycolate phosphatase-like HAD superfamily hydrolase
MLIKEAIQQSEFIIFDCDGVLMDTNRIKEDGFAQIARSYFGNEAVQFIRKYHRRHGGLSRALKFKALMDSFPLLRATEIESLCIEFDSLTSMALLEAKLAENLDEILSELIRQGKYLVVLSGTPQTNLRYLLEKRRLSEYFNLVLGSPLTKIDHLTRLHDSGQLSTSTSFVFIGDSLVDYDAAMHFPNCRFYWSEEFGEMSDYDLEKCSPRKIRNLSSISGH